MITFTSGYGAPGAMSHFGLNDPHPAMRATVTEIVRAYKAGATQMGGAKAITPQYRQLGGLIQSWVRSTGVMPVKKWVAMAIRLGLMVQDASGISWDPSVLGILTPKATLNGDLRGFGAFGWDWTDTANLLIPGLGTILGSDTAAQINTLLGSSSSPQDFANNSATTLSQALSAGTITQDQYNQAMNQVNQAAASAAAQTVGGQFQAAGQGALALGQGLLSGAEGLAVVAGLGLAAYIILPFLGRR